MNRLADYISDLHAMVSIALRQLAPFGAILREKNVLDLPPNEIPDLSEIDHWLSARKYKMREKKYLLDLLDEWRSKPMGPIYEYGEDKQNMNPLGASLLFIILESRFDDLYPFVPVDDYYLAEQDRSNHDKRLAYGKLKKCEQWAIRNKYLTNDGKWNKEKSNSPDKDLAHFLQSLINLKILIDPEDGRGRNALCDYFCRRYHYTSIKNSFRRDKINSRRLKEFGILRLQ
jgi:hypothetical protein